MPRRSLLLSTVGSILGVSLMGCGSAGPAMDGEDPGSPVVDQTSQDLLGDPTRYWCANAQNGMCPAAGSPPMVNVCWEPSSFNNSAFNNVRAWTEDAIRSNWARYGRLNLVTVSGAGTWQVCSPGQPGIHAYVRTNSECGGTNNGVGINHDGVTNGIGVPDCNPSSSCGLAANSSQEVCVKRIAMHEFGHGIGFFHEEQRDPGLPDCDPRNNTPPIPGTKYGAFNQQGIMSDCDGPQAAAGITTLTALDQAAIQRAYGRRISGQLVSTAGRCLASFGNGQGEQPFMWDCDEFQDDQEWDYDFNTGLMKMRGLNFCLSGRTSSTIGTENCNSGDSFHKWAFRDTYLRSYGKCLDLNGGNTNGGGVQAWDCGALNGANQKWYIKRSVFPDTGEIRFGGSPGSASCLTVPASGSGQLTVTPCNGSGRQRFHIATANQQIISDTFLSSCLDIQSELDSTYMSGVGGPANGQPVQLHACIAGQFNQKWTLTGAIMNDVLFPNTAAGCLTRKVDKGQGSQLSLGVCNGSNSQLFDYYAL
jgi:hypothetical protein